MSSYTEHEKSWAAREDAARRRALDQSRWATWLARLAPLIVRLRADHAPDWEGLSDCPVCGCQQSIKARLNRNRQVESLVCSTPECVESILPPNPFPQTPPPQP